MSTTNEVCTEAMGIMQNFGDYRWKKCLVAFESGNESETKTKEENENLNIIRKLEKILQNYIETKIVNFRTQSISNLSKNW